MTGLRKSPAFGYLFLLVLIAAMGYGGSAYALMYGGGIPIPCPVISPFQYTFMVVTCLQLAIEDVTLTMLAGFSAVMWGPIGALITFQITMFGIQAVMGSSEINKKFYSLLLKIGCVVLFADNLGGFAPDVFDIMEEAQMVVVSGLGWAPSPLCLPAVALGAASPFFNSAIWLQLDCFIDQIFMFGMPMMMYNSIFAFISAALFSGSVGVMVFFVGIIMLLCFLGFVFQAVYIFICSYLYVGFLIVLSPLLIPMMLVGVSASMYEKWLNNILGGIAIPVLVYLVLIFSLPLITGALQPLQDLLGTDYSPWYRNEQQWCSQQVGTDDAAVGNYDNVPGSGGWLNQPYAQNLLNPMLKGSTDYCAAFNTSSVDFLGKHVEMMMGVLDTLIHIFVPLYLLMKVMTIMPAVAAVMFQGGWNLANLAQQGLPFSSAMRGGMQDARNSMTRGMGLLNRGLPGGAAGG